jgi:hypothetical protein
MRLLSDQDNTLKITVGCDDPSCDGRVFFDPDAAEADSDARLGRCNECGARYRMDNGTIHRTADRRGRDDHDARR